MGGATCDYEPTEVEKKFYDRLGKDARVTLQTKPNELDESHTFKLHGHQGEFVSWWGIVRAIKQQSGGVGILLIENKYFDGLTDCNFFQSISISGGGDFETELTKIPDELIPLVLVRVYGVVTREQNKPCIKADYVRVWHQGQFGFFSYGEDHGNPEWKKNAKLASDENPYIHDSARRYYRDHLGPTADQLEILERYYKDETTIEYANFPLDASPRSAVYEPTEQEKPYLERLNKDDQRTVQSKPGEPSQTKFQLRGHVGQFVSWFGIVREVESTIGRRRASLLIENKYFRGEGGGDPVTISIKGGGNFTAKITHLAANLPLLLVRVYGTVVREENNVPVVQVSYIRVWRWGEFKFDNYGEDRGDPRWKTNTILSSNELIPNTRVAVEYYVQRLAPTAEQALKIKSFFEGLERQRKTFDELPAASVETTKP